MPARRESLLDSFAMLAFLNAESGFEKVRTLLRAAQSTGIALLMNEFGSQTRTMTKKEELSWPGT